MPPIEELIFVYNADSNFFAEMFGFAHKILLPKSYACNLCKVTYGNFTMKSEWKEFLGSLPQKKIFLYRHEFAKAFAQFKGVVLPLIIARDAQRTYVLVSARELNGIKEISKLKDLINLKISSRTQAPDFR